MTEKFCLQWNDFKENVLSAFRGLRAGKDFADVTLACEDGEKIEAHKVILAASSPVFANILLENKNSHPLIFLKGFRLQDLVTILDFLYFGEATVHQDNLESFLAIAEELKLKGLKGKSSTNKMKMEKADTNSKHVVTKSKQKSRKSNKLSVKKNLDPEVSEENIAMAVAIPIESDVDQRGLDEMISSMMKKSENMTSNGRLADGRTVQKKAFVCKMCGKEGPVGNIRNHIEANHLDGPPIPCGLCEKEFCTRKALQHHKRRQHSHRA